MPNMKVFLSYALEDEPVATDLTRRLEKAGLNVWQTGRDVLPGDNIALRVGKALEEADAMVVLVSPASMKSFWVQREIEYALGNANYENRLIPVLIRRTSNTPWIANSRHTIKAGPDRSKLSQAIIRHLQSASAERN